MVEKKKKKYSSTPGPNHLFLVRRSIYPIYQHFKHNRMQIRGHILLLRVIIQRHVDLLKENWGQQQQHKKSISQVLLGLTSHLKRANSL